MKPELNLPGGIRVPIEKIVRFRAILTNDDVTPQTPKVYVDCADGSCGSAGPAVMVYCNSDNECLELKGRLERELAECRASWH